MRQRPKEGSDDAEAKSLNQAERAGVAALLGKNTKGPGGLLAKARCGDAAPPAPPAVGRGAKHAPMVLPPMSGALPMSGAASDASRPHAASAEGAAPQADMPLAPRTSITPPLPLSRSNTPSFKGSPFARLAIGEKLQ
jgi:hypothetical protein